MGEFVFYGCKTMESITLPAGLTAIERESFNGCSKLKSIKFPNNVNTIRHHAFYACSGLTSITFGSSMTTVDRYAFCDCSGVKTLVLNKALKTVGGYVFYCKNLENIYYEGTEATKANINIDYTHHASNGRHNDALKNIAWTFSACIGNSETFIHEYTDEYDSECDHCLKRTRTAERRPTETEETTPTEPSVTTTPADNTSSSNSTLIIIVIAVIVLVAGTIVGCVLFIKHNNKKDTADTKENTDKTE